PCASLACTAMAHAAACVGVRAVRGAGAAAGIPDAPLRVMRHVSRSRRGRARGAPGAAGREPPPFPMGSRVSHRAWGAGVVVDCDGDKVTVRFEAVGDKLLAVPVVRDKGLLSLMP